MAQNINKNIITNLLKDKNFEELFISELLWNRPSGAAIPSLTFDGCEYTPKSVAQKNGLEVFECILSKIPTPTDCKALDVSMRRLAKDYIAIYHTADGCAQVWAAPIKKEERIQVVCINIADPDKAAEYITPKINTLAFAIDDSDITIIDVKAKVQQAFAVNSEKITKSFYDGFKKEHKAFAKFIEGINDNIASEQNKDKQWYASIMLNRLMFCYFIQKKGFLDNNPNYLSDKLEYVKANEGEDKYFSSFYRGFLLRLFSEGLNTPGSGNGDFRQKFGNIPYLNGGLFDLHQIEREYTSIEIPDIAFENLFKFFDNWNWCLDTRVTATGRDINPDVLGYIFEQYINDRAQMGAYYTKEDITGYIAKNCIIPFIFDKMATTTSAKDFRPNGYVWQKLKTSGYDYIYDAMKRGIESFPDNIPQEIAAGIDTAAPDLLNRRRLWNNPAPSKIALPTETWREAIDRWQRCQKTEKLISDGSITNANDLITNNLNILQFAIDLIRDTDMAANHLFVKHFYDILQKITILDPTCGSGAFLFAALNILEPLYEECIAKMEQCRDKFEDELNEISVHYRSNKQYFIFKSIILRNLYGVDIMPEAIEVAKLRLFLKLVAVVDCDPRKENLGLDPLPDIDFNIRCGNTLVGYANQKELDRANVNEGFFNAEEFRDKVEFEMEKISLVYKRYRDIQLRQKKEERNEDFVKSKAELQERLAALNQILNQRLYSLTPKLQTIDKWVAQTQPFHWIAEFYEIINNGGFDVIIGNPPYVSATQISYIKNTNAFSCSDLFGFVIKRVFELLQSEGTHGFIVMHNLAFSRNFKDVRKLLFSKNGSYWFSFYSRIPAGLFSGDVRVRNCIYIYLPKNNQRYSSILRRWFGVQRESLFNAMPQYCLFNGTSSSVVPMLSDSKLLEIFENQNGENIELLKCKTGSNIFFKKIAYNWLAVSNVEAPAYNKKKESIPQSELGCITIEKKYFKAVLLLMAGKIYLSKWLTYGDDFHLTDKDLIMFKYPFNKISKEDMQKLDSLYDQFVEGLPQTVQFKLNAGKYVGTFNTSLLQNITTLSDDIFFKYLVKDVSLYRELIENHLAYCVISNKMSNEELNEE